MVREDSHTGPDPASIYKQRVKRQKMDLRVTPEYDQRERKLFNPYIGFAEKITDAFSSCSSWTRKLIPNDHTSHILSSSALLPHVDFFDPVSESSENRFFAENFQHVIEAGAETHT